MTNDEIIREAYGSIVGRKIVKVRPLMQEELDDMYWNQRYGSVGFAIILDDGQVLIPSCDPEGNGPGHVFIGELS